MGTSTNIRRWSANCRLSSMLILYMPLLCSFYACCEARDTLRQGEWISDNGETLVSAGGRFEFGFFSPTEALATKDTLEYGTTSGITEQLYGLSTEIAQLSMPMEFSTLQKMASSRYWIRLERYIGLRIFEAHVRVTGP